MPKSQIILWLGLLMITLQIVKEWPTISATLFGTASSGQGPAAPTATGPGAAQPTSPTQVPIGG